MPADVLRDFAARYIWWKTPEEAIRFPDRVLAQVMDLGTFADMQRLLKAFDNARLLEVLHQAEAGWFSPRSWHFWHYRLHAALPGAVPPLPQKQMA